MKPGLSIVRGVMVSSLVLALSGCVALGMPGFGDGASCSTGYVLIGGVVQPVNSCGGLPRDTLVASTLTPVAGADLPALLAAPKFEPDAFYTGVDTPADKAPLTKIVNDAVRDVIAMPAPRDPARVRQRLASAIQAVHLFATEDREHAHMYLILAWRTAGFVSESGLFPVPDRRVLEVH